MTVSAGQQATPGPTWPLAAVDLHQHLWPEELVERLRARSRTPFLRGWTLHTAGEPPYEVEADHHDVWMRQRQNARDGIGLACVSFSAPLGVESLRGPSAQRLLDAWHVGAAALPTGFAAWASVRRDEPDLAGLADLLDSGFVGVQVPATDVGTPGDWERLGAVLEVSERAGKPVFVHPGPERSAPGARHLPAWWPAVVGYAAQLQAAWWAWHAAEVRRSHPELRVVFAAGAGLAPVHHERYVARGGTSGKVDPLVHVDTSSYGPQGLDALVRVLGIDALVLGSDRPYAAPVAPTHLGEAAGRAIRVENPRRVLGLPSVAQEGGAHVATRELTAPAVPALADLPQRDLEPHELEALVRAVAADPEGWAHLVGFDDDERVYASLHRDAHVDVWLLCWTPVNDTGWHDHDISSGAVAVVAGELVENNLRIGSPAVEKHVGAGASFGFTADHIHRLNGAERGTVSIHAYSPPLWRMGQYAVDDAGVLRRVSVSYADELRPID